MSITLILGDKGAGKTSMAYGMAITQMFNRDRYRQAKKIVDELVEGGYSQLSLPEHHLVYTETSCFSRLIGHPRWATYECNGSRFGLPTGDNEVDFFPPCSYIVYDEGQKDVDSRNFASLEDYVKRGWETCRHMEYDLVYISQWGNIDKALRKLCDRVLYVSSKGQKTSRGKYKHVVSYWNFIEFQNFEEFNSWTEAGQPKKKTSEFVFDGDIKRCYDGEAFRPLWFVGRRNSDFNKVVNEIVSPNVESYERFQKRFKI